MYASRAETAGTTVDLHPGAAAASTTISGDRAGDGEDAARREWAAWRAEKCVGGPSPFRAEHIGLCIPIVQPAALDAIFAKAY